MMLGYLLARSGVGVVVLEKHADFFRDFRGDTIHPSTLDVISELGLLDEFLRLPHDQVTSLSGIIGETTIPIADFSHLPTRCKFLALMPQWDFLDFLATQAKKFPSFHLMMNVEAQDVIREGDRVCGVRVLTPEGVQDILADLVIGADGRYSTIRRQAGLESRQFGAPMDVLWMRMSRKPSDPGQTFGRFDRGLIFISLNRTTYWQCGYVIPKGAFDGMRQQSIDSFRQSVVRIAPFLADRVDELRSWDDVKLLTVAVNRLEKWYKPGLLCIGDAAHAMSPIGGVGINLAIQDAVATANILCKPLLSGSVSEADLQAVQRRRLFPTRVIQGMQLFIQRRLITRILGNGAATQPPKIMQAFVRFPALRRLPAWFIGVGVRPEHVHCKALESGL